MIALMQRAALIVACVGVLVVFAAMGAGADQKLELYSGSLDRVDLAAWGAGTVEQTDEEMYLEAETLRVDTKGFFEGGRLDLKAPQDMASYLSKPEGGYVMMMVKAHKPEPEPTEIAPGPGEIVPGGEFPLVPGAEDAMPAEVMAEDVMAEEPMADMAGEEAWGMEPGMGVPVTVAQPPAPPPEVTRLRLLLVTEQGELDSGPVVLAQCAEVVDGWLRVVVPLSSFKGARAIKAGKLEQIALLGDVDEHFYVGQLVLGQEDAPLVADAGDNVTARVEQEATFTAKPQPGGARATYSWDFDDLDGIQEEGFGAEATWTFLTPGYYVVTVTASDPAGQKVPRTDRISVKVEE